MCKRNGKKGSQRLQESTPLPAGLEGLQVGTMLKHGKHRDIAPELLDYQLETPIFFGQGYDYCSYLFRDALCKLP